MDPGSAAQSAAFDVARDPMMVVRGGRVVAANAAAGRLLDYERAQLLQLPDLESIVDPAGAAELRQCLREGSPADIPVTLWTRRGDELAAELSVRPHGPEVLLVLRPALRESSGGDGYRQLIEHLPDGLLTLDGAGEILHANRTLASMLGFRSVGGLAALSLLDLVDEADRAPVRAAMRRWLQGEGTRLEATLRALDGSAVPALLSGRALPRRPGMPPATAVLVTDFAERQALSERLSQARQMEALSRLAGGIAHDFNNLLTGILGNASRIRELGQAPELDDLTRSIEDSAELAARLTRRLMALVRGQSPDRRLIDVAELAQQTLRLLGRILPSSIVLQTEFEPGLPPVLADESQLQQAFLNLCINARDAMVAHQGGGLLRVRVGRGVLSKPLDDGSTAEEPAVVLMVSDNGPGVPRELRSRIFDPFFTTKGLGHGVGLGLATVWQLLEAHGGSVEVDDTPGGGARFTLRLPARPGDRAQAVSAASRSSGDGEVASESARILVAEDERAIRRMVAAALRQKGYEVVTARDGVEAIALWRAYEGDIDLLFLDVRMPGAEGPEVLAVARQTRPQVPAIFSSGFIPEQHEREPARDRVCYLPKPYRVAELLSAVRTAISMGSEIRATATTASTSPVFADSNGFLRASAPGQGLDAGRTILDEPPLTLTLDEPATEEY